MGEDGIGQKGEGSNFLKIADTFQYTAHSLSYLRLIMQLSSAIVDFFNSMVGLVICNYRPF